MIFASVYPACFMNFRVQIFKADPLSIITLFYGKIGYHDGYAKQKGVIWLDHGYVGGFER